MTAGDRARALADLRDGLAQHVPAALAEQQRLERGPRVAGEPAADRLMAALDYRLSRSGTSRLTRPQVAVVLHALADHTALEAARVYSRHDLWNRDRKSPWPTTTSIGRWLHATADDLEAGR